MHRKLLCSGFALALVLGFSACEQHDWESTQRLHQSHGGHGHEEGHGKGHDGDEHPAKEGEDHGHASKEGEGHDKDAPEKEAEAKPRDLGTE